MRKWCVVALGVSVLVTGGAAMWNVPRAEDEVAVPDQSGALMIIGFLSTIVSVFCVFASSSGADARSATSKDDEASTVWPRTED